MLGGQGYEQRPAETRATPGHPAHRLFFALFPDAATAERIAQVAQRLHDVHGLRGKLPPTERFHVTLHHLGDHAEARPDIVARASEAAAQVAMPAFELRFDRAMSFARRHGKRPWVLRSQSGLDALARFQRTLGAALERANLGCWVAPIYTPHLTLLYGEQPLAEQGVEPLAWTATEFVLMDSLIGQSRHVPLGHWPLAAPAR